PIDGCDPLSVNLQAITDADPGADIVWDLGNGTTRTGKDNMRDIDEVFTGHGSYTVKMTVTNTPAKGSCIQQATPVQITVKPSPVAAFVSDRTKTTVALPGIQFTDRSTIPGTSSVINKWDWSFGDRNNSTSTLQNPFFEYPVTLPSDTGIFDVLLRVEADNQCWDTASAQIHIAPDITVFIPNAFTPNQFGDAMNNRFFVIADGYETLQINIFTRWGEQVYESTNINEGWDGMYKGKEAQQDVYVYVVRVTAVGGKEYEYYGTIALLR